MKRTSSALTPSPQRSPDHATATASTALQPPGTSLEDFITDDTPDEVITAARHAALQAGDDESLCFFLAVRPELPLRMHMDASTRAETVCTLVDALPDDMPSPPIELSGSLPDQVPVEALTTLFTHPTLHTLSLTDLELSSDQLASVVQAVRTTPSALTSLHCSDDIECLLDPGLADLIEALGSLRRLALGTAGGGPGPMDHQGPAALRLAGVLLDKPLDGIVLEDFGPFMEALRRSLTSGHVPTWGALTVSFMGLTPHDTREITELTVVLVRCLAQPGLRTLTLKDFFIHDQDMGDADRHTLALPDFFVGDEDPAPPEPTADACSSAAYGMARALAEALSRRSVPLHLVLDSTDIAALNLLMGGVTGHPARPGASLTEPGPADSPVAGGIHCVRALSIAYRPTLEAVIPVSGQHPGLEGFLQGITAWVPRLGRLDALTVTLEPVPAWMDDHADHPRAAPELAATTLTGVARTLELTHLTSLTFDGLLLTPVPDLLQPCLQQVHARALHVELQTRSLDVCFGFLHPLGGRGMHLPAELGRRLVADIQASGPDPVTTLPALSRRQFTTFVDRYNEQILRENARRPDGMPGLPEHPQTALRQAIGQRMRADQVPADAGLR